MGGGVAFTPNPLGEGAEDPEPSHKPLLPSPCLHLSDSRPFWKLRFPMLCGRPPRQGHPRPGQHPGSQSCFPHTHVPSGPPQARPPGTPSQLPTALPASTQAPPEWRPGTPVPLPYVLLCSSRISDLTHPPHAHGALPPADAARDPRTGTHRGRTWRRSRAREGSVSSHWSPND